MRTVNFLGFLTHRGIVPSPQAVSKIQREHPNKSAEERFLLSKAETLLDVAFRYKAAVELITKTKMR